MQVRANNNIKMQSFYKTASTTVKNKKMPQCSRVKVTKVEVSLRARLEEVTVVHRRSPHRSQSYALNRSGASKTELWRKTNFKISCKRAKGRLSRGTEDRIFSMSASIMISYRWRVSMRKSKLKKTKDQRIVVMHSRLATMMKRHWLMIHHRGEGLRQESGKSR